ncbi:phosphoenolpyruvate--protein phosphotransferase, partial [Salmonella enterica subsp. enterica serovar Typhimurium]|uniref:PEP-utilizing enzyme n=1 Tax=Salmonella enterica TaxID=28901 RepID=UPI000CAF09DA
VLADPDLMEQTISVIRDKKINAESAFQETTDTFINMFEAMEDNPYMQERAADIKDVRKRVIAHLLGVTLPDPSTIDKEVIIVAKDLTPSDTAQLNKEYVKAFVTDVGGRTSHSAIMARSLEIPAVVGVGNLTSSVTEDDKLIVDGLNGEVLINP